MKPLDHENLVRFYHHMTTKKRIILVQEYLGGDDLFTVAQQANERGIQFDEEYVRKVFHQALKAIKFIHEHGVCHRDIKLENFVFEKKEGDGGSLKLIDFGLSSTFSIGNTGFSSMNSSVGTPFYMSPEVFDKKYD